MSALPKTRMGLPAMPILDNPRHEHFAQFIAEGRTATEAYELAGYKPSRQNAQRLTTNDDIRARVAELQQQAAAKHEITRDRITEMLLKGWKAAHQNKQIGRQGDVTVREASAQPMTAEEWNRLYCRGADTH